jgi:hypothetical protein
MPAYSGGSACAPRKVVATRTAAVGQRARGAQHLELVVGDRP